MENIIKLPPDFSVIVNHSFVQKGFDEETKHQIEDIWKKELIRTNGKLFNGKLLSAEEFDGKQMIAHFVEYKHYLAYSRDPSLDICIRPLCVCGYTTSDENILFGLRADYVTDFPNYFELVPAGGLDPSSMVNNKIDVIKQLRIELKEEAGIEESMIRSIVPTYLVEYYEPCTYEIVAKIELNASAKNWVGERDDEYTELIWVHKHNLNEFVNLHRKKIIPLSLQILNLFKTHD